MIIPWQPVVLAIANRARDGWITEALPPTNPIAKFFTTYSQMGRLILWGVPLAGTVMLTYSNADLGKDLWMFLVFVIGAFLSSTVPAWGPYDKPPFTAVSILNLSCCGIEFILFPVLAIFTYRTAGIVLHETYGTFGFTAGVLLLTAGLLMPVAYVLGWVIPGKWHGTPWGSFIFGAIIGLALYPW